jgi:hypothetical protein
LYVYSFGDPVNGTDPTGEGALAEYGSVLFWAFTGSFITEILYPKILNDLDTCRPNVVGTFLGELIYSELVVSIFGPVSGFWNSVISITAFVAVGHGSGRLVHENLIDPDCLPTDWEDSPGWDPPRRY